jgi:hypothetical protein
MVKRGVLNNVISYGGAVLLLLGVYAMTFSLWWLVLFVPLISLWTVYMIFQYRMWVRSL